MRLRFVLALASWGSTVVMMHPSAAALAVACLNAAILAVLVRRPVAGHPRKEMPDA